jgi:hypothetical protein
MSVIQVDIIQEVFYEHSVGSHYFSFSVGEKYVLEIVVSLFVFQTPINMFANLGIVMNHCMNVLTLEAVSFPYFIILYSIIRKWEPG